CTIGADEIVRMAASNAGAIAVDMVSTTTTPSLAPCTVLFASALDSMDTFLRIGTIWIAPASRSAPRSHASGGVLPPSCARIRADNATPLQPHTAAARDH